MDIDPTDIAGLSRAADAGDGAAALRLAVLCGLGLGRPQDWSEALSRLDQAAATGDRDAVFQKTLLAPAGGAVDLTAWLTPPPWTVVSERPHVLSLSGFVSPALCDHLIDLARPRLARAQVYDPTTGRGRVASHRSNSAFAFNLETTDLVLVLLRERIARTAGLPVTGLEPSQVLRYGVGETFDWHVDWLDPAIPGQASDLAARGQRIATLLLYLNDDFEGGETAFESGGLRHRARRGDALMWANTLPQGGVDRSTRHAGLPPTRGEKWVLSQWMRPAPPRATEGSGAVLAKSGLKRAWEGLSHGLDSNFDPKRDTAHRARGLAGCPAVHRGVADHPAPFPGGRPPSAG
ncbi:prolyl 4-hydroxylase [Brevundimonas variabilis]|uniref:Prolyl 4-hydroxylase n=2 Tax=Brevundimonas variabilis TaxID=74312 RepID=A0A7W9CG73_9CAUL|nr:prolyl 4-hydroxylase [Brevundimonas variabilis]